MLALRNRLLLVLDGLMLAASPAAAYAIRFEGLALSGPDARTLFIYTLLSAPLKLGIFLSLGLYRRLWRHSGIAELAQITEASAISATACGVLGLFLLTWSGLAPTRVPLSAFFLDSYFTIAIVTVPRILPKAIAIHKWRRRRNGAQNVLIAGAGAAGEMIVKELRANAGLGLVPIGFVDDDGEKHGQFLSDLPVLGPISAIPDIVARGAVREVLLAMPTAPGPVVRRVVQAAREAGVSTRTVPALFEILSGNIGITKLREVRIEDLLRRAAVHTDLGAVRALVNERVVLVTGGGGSIGSELCRQLVKLGPAELILLGHGENSIFEIHQELRAHFPEQPFRCAIADVRNADRIRALFEHFRPHLVFHAAAHKHVPLMEENIAEAVTNNVLGTRNVVDAATACGTQHLVLISTDKAVHPTSIMGATKRTAELIVRQAALRHGRSFMSVRFGNVLGSRGSVVPTFLRQIRAGGPVTITHPEMRRYFMTIPEAVQLVLQAGALGAGGEVFVLDMGEPVRILDLATDLVRLSGLEPGADIELRFTGLRPGEKLFEEVFFDEESAVPTTHPKVLRAKHVAGPAGATERIEALIAAAVEGRSDAELRAALHAIVPDFITPTNGAEPVVVPQPFEVLVSRPVVRGDQVPSGLGVFMPPKRSNGTVVHDQ